MTAFIDKIFSQSQADAIRSLWKDEDKITQELIQKEIGRTILSSDKLIDELPLTQLMFITSTSDFASSQDECVHVATILHWGINKSDILPRVTEHKGKELASRCLISLGLFYRTMERKCDRYGAPSPEFYREVGITLFDREGLIEVSHHFRDWEEFIREVFNISS